MNKVGQAHAVSRQLVTWSAGAQLLQSVYMGW